MSVRLNIAATVLVAALAVLLFAVVLPGHADRARAARQAFSPDQRAAMSAATVEAVNLLSYSRSHFDSDFSRALAGTTGDLKKDLTGEKSVTLQALKKNKIDLTADTQAAALVPAPAGKQAASSVQVLVVVTGSTVDDSGKATPTKVERVAMTMVRSGSKWLASGIQVAEGA
ncbi:MAG TPA: hypothetical protein VGL26_04460 [Jatrophihabitans sp.]|jgi:hypothetical protein